MQPCLSLTVSHLLTSKSRLHHHHHTPLSPVITDLEPARCCSLSARTVQVTPGTFPLSFFSLSLSPLDFFLSSASFRTSPWLSSIASHRITSHRLRPTSTSSVDPVLLPLYPACLPAVVVVGHRLYTITPQHALVARHHHTFAYLNHSSPSTVRSLSRNQAPLLGIHSPSVTANPHRHPPTSRTSSRHRITSSSAISIQPLPSDRAFAKQLAEHPS